MVVAAMENIVLVLGLLGITGMASFKLGTRGAVIGWVALSSFVYVALFLNMGIMVIGGLIVLIGLNLLVTTVAG